MINNKTPNAHYSALSGMSKEFINNAVQALYKYEASLVNMGRLLTDAEMEDFYVSFKGAYNA